MRVMLGTRSAVQSARFAHTLIAALGPLPCAFAAAFQMTHYSLTTTFPFTTLAAQQRSH